MGGKSSQSEKKGFLMSLRLTITYRMFRMRRGLSCDRPLFYTRRRTDLQTWYQLYFYSQFPDPVLVQSYPFLFAVSCSISHVHFETQSIGPRRW